MNDERFIEMLNLYIDRELAESEIHEIEAAIAASAERQRIYAQYCQIERASRRLLSDTRVPQPRITDLIAAARSDTDQIEFPLTATAAPSRRWLAWGGAAAALAAACLAVVLSISAPKSGTGESTAVAAISPPAPVAVQESSYETVFVLGDRAAGRVPGMRAVDDSFAWMTQLQFAPIERTELDNWKMEAAEPIEMRSLNPRWVTPVGYGDSAAPEALTAFQFQR